MFLRFLRSITKAISIVLVCVFTGDIALFDAKADIIGLPSTVLSFQDSSNYSFPVLKGLKLNTNNPLKIDFIINTGNDSDVDKDEAVKLIRYFLAGISMNDKDFWVNLSPHESGRIIPATLEQTNLGEDMLAQDYCLKQMAAGLTHPGTLHGQQYWHEINGGVAKGSLSKVWIKPDKAAVYEHQNIVVIKEATLKAEMDDNDPAFARYILPIINEKVNTSRDFAAIRQIYSALVLAKWFKEKFKASFYRYYINSDNVKGIDLADKDAKEKIYTQYLEAFQKGAYNFIRSEHAANKIIKRKYFCGGVEGMPQRTSNLPADVSQIQWTLNAGGGKVSVVSTSVDRDYLPLKRRAVTLSDAQRELLIAIGTRGLPDKFTLHDLRKYYDQPDKVEAILNELTDIGVLEVDDSRGEKVWCRKLVVLFNKIASLFKTPFDIYGKFNDLHRVADCFKEIVAVRNSFLLGDYDILAKLLRSMGCLRLFVLSQDGYLGKEALSDIFATAAQSEAWCGLARDLLRESLAAIYYQSTEQTDLINRASSLQCALLDSFAHYYDKDLAADVADLFRDNFIQLNKPVGHDVENAVWRALSLPARARGIMRGPDGRFIEHPGKNYKDAARLIEDIGLNNFAYSQYKKAYEDNAERLVYERNISESTARKDLELLVETGYLAVDRSVSPQRWNKTNQVVALMQPDGSVRFEKDSPIRLASERTDYGAGNISALNSIIDTLNRHIINIDDIARITNNALPPIVNDLSDEDTQRLTLALINLYTYDERINVRGYIISMVRTLNVSQVAAVIRGIIQGDFKSLLAKRSAVGRFLRDYTANNSENSRRLDNLASGWRSLLYSEDKNRASRNNRNNGNDLPPAGSVYAVFDVLDNSLITLGEIRAKIAAHPAKYKFRGGKVPSLKTLRCDLYNLIAAKVVQCQDDSLPLEQRKYFIGGLPYAVNLSLLKEQFKKLGASRNRFNVRKAVAAASIKSGFPALFPINIDSRIAADRYDVLTLMDTIVVLKSAFGRDQSSDMKIFLFLAQQANAGTLCDLAQLAIDSLPKDQHLSAILIDIFANNVFSEIFPQAIKALAGFRDKIKTDNSPFMVGHIAAVKDLLGRYSTDHSAITRSNIQPVLRLYRIYAPDEFASAAVSLMQYYAALDPKISTAVLQVIAEQPSDDRIDNILEAFKITPSHSTKEASDNVRALCEEAAKILTNINSPGSLGALSEVAQDDDGVFSSQGVEVAKNSNAAFLRRLITPVPSLRQGLLPFHIPAGSAYAVFDVLENGPMTFSQIRERIGLDMVNVPEKRKYKFRNGKIPAEPTLRRDLRNLLRTGVVVEVSTNKPQTPDTVRYRRSLHKGVLGEDILSQLSDIGATRDLIKIQEAVGVGMLHSRMEVQYRQGLLGDLLRCNDNSPNVVFAIVYLAKNFLTADIEMRIRIYSFLKARQSGRFPNLSRAALDYIGPVDIKRTEDYMLYTSDDGFHAAQEPDRKNGGITMSDIAIAVDPGLLPSDLQGVDENFFKRIDFTIFKIERLNSVMQLLAG